jgi:hypothetical protein
MKLNDAKKQIDQILAGLFYERMKNVSQDETKSHEMYKKTANEMNQLLVHMKGRLDILFGNDTEALAQFLGEAKVLE